MPAPDTEAIRKLMAHYYNSQGEERWATGVEIIGHVYDLIRAAERAERLEAKLAEKQGTPCPSTTI